jgi:hypothetical protein
MRSDLLAAARRLMSRHHAAAIALLGWYLMIPPRDEKGVLQPRRPLRKWNRAASYNPAQECEVGKFKALDAKGNGSLFLASKCIASDDPRLAK